MIEDAVVIEASDGVFAVQGINDITIVEGGMQGPPGPINLISGTGIVVQTGLNAFVTRSISVGTGMSITNPDGVAGNPSITLAAVLVGIVGGSMNGVVIGNTTPAAGTFTTLNVTGVSQFASGSAAAPGIAFSAAPSSGFYRGASAGRVNATHGGTASASFGAGGIFAPSTGFFAFTASSDPDIGTGDTFLVRDAANTLAQRNAANGQTFNVYQTYTDGSNYQRFTILASAAGSALRIGHQNAGTGAARDLIFITNGDKWGISANTGALYTSADNSYDVGDTTHRPRDVFVGRNLFVGTTGSYLGSIVNIAQASTVTAAATDVGVYISRSDNPDANSSSTSSAVFVESNFLPGSTFTGSTQIGIHGRTLSQGAGSGTLNASYSFTSEFIQQTTSRTTTNVAGFRTLTTTVSSGSVTTYGGFDSGDQASANVVTAISFRGRMASGTNRWNLFLDGSAPNHIAGSLYVGTTASVVSEKVALQTSDSSTSGSPRLVFTRFTLNPVSASTMDAIVEQVRALVTTNNGANARGVRADIETGANVTVPQYVGFEATSALSVTAGVLTTGYGFLGAPGSNGTIGTWMSFYASNTSNVTNSYGFRGGVNSGANKFNLYLDGTAQNYVGGNINLITTATFGWGTTTTPDVVLARDAANALAQRNGVSAQTFRIYNTFTDSSNYERFAIRFNTGNIELASDVLGTGSAARTISLFAGSSSAGLRFGLGSTVYWRIDSGAGVPVTPNVDNSYDIGTTSLRPRDVYVARNLFVGATAVSLGAVATISQASTNAGGGFDVAASIIRSDTPASNSTTTPHALYVDSQFQAGTTITSTTQIGVRGRVTSQGSGTGTLSSGISFVSEFVQQTAVRTTNNAIGFNAVTTGVTAGTVTNYYGVQVNDQPSTSIDNAFGIRSVLALVTGKTRWNIYSDGAAANAFVGMVSFGSVNVPGASIDINGNVSAASWTTNGIGLRLRGNTYTDTSTGVSGTAVTNHIHAIAIPTLAATNATVTTTTAATLYIAGAPTAGTNMTITNARTLLIGGGVSEFPKGTASAPALRIGSTSGIYEEVTNGRIVFADGATNLARIIPGSTFDLLADGGLLRLGASSDVVLARDAANTLAQRNGTNLQTFCLYGTYTDSSNYERVELVTQAGVSVLRQTQAGTGTARGLSLTTVGNVGIRFATNNTNRYQIQNDGHLSPMTDDTYTVGAGSLRPQGVYVTRTIVLAGPTGFVNGITMSSAATTASPSIVAAGSDANITLTISSKGTGDLKLDPATGDIQITKALVALGGGAAPTLGTIGGSGPATAAQNTWLRLKDSGGNAFWVPAWK